MGHQFGAALSKLTVVTTMSHGRTCSRVGEFWASGIRDLTRVFRPTRVDRSRGGSFPSSLLRSQAPWVCPPAWAFRFRDDLQHLDQFQGVTSIQL